MMKCLAALSLLLSSAAFAHIDAGTYKGKTADGKDCSFMSGPTYFEKNTPHPLNERIAITIDGKTFVVGHPPVVNAKEAVAFFDHDHFQGILPTPTGAEAVEIEMVHSAEYEGPKSLTWIGNEWREQKRASFRCENLEFVK